MGNYVFAHGLQVQKLRCGAALLARPQLFLKHGLCIREGEEGDRHLPAGYYSAGPLIDAEPGGVDFESDVYIMLPAHSHGEAVMVWHPKSGWDTLDARCNNGYFYIRVRHFYSFWPVSALTTPIPVRAQAFYHSDLEELRVVFWHLGCAYCEEKYEQGYAKMFHDEGWDRAVASVTLNFVKQNTPVHISPDSCPQEKEATLDFSGFPQDVQVGDCQSPSNSFKVNLIVRHGKGWWKNTETKVLTFRKAINPMTSQREPSSLPSSMNTHLVAGTDGPQAGEEGEHVPEEGEGIYCRISVQKERLDRAIESGSKATLFQILAEKWGKNIGDPAVRSSWTLTPGTSARMVLFRQSSQVEPVEADVKLALRQLIYEVQLLLDDCFPFDMRPRIVKGSINWTPQESQVVSRPSSTIDGRGPQSSDD